MNTTPNIATEESKKRLASAMELRAERKAANKPKNELIKDFRVYYTSLPNRALYPYDYQLVEIFYNLLKRGGLMCPIYHHLYIQIEPQIEESILRSIPYDNQMIYGVSTIDYKTYSGGSQTTKAKLVFDAIVTGLKDIADLDKLDEIIINKTIEEVEVNMLDTELEHIVAESEKYVAKITYLSKSLEEGNPVYLNIVEKTTAKSATRSIGKVTKDALYFWIDKLTINKDKIKIKSRSSAKADFYLKDLPRSMEFDIKKNNE